MPNTLFFVNQLRKKFLSQDVKNFNMGLPQNVLDIEDKNRSNLFCWRGQFSPQLIENIMLAYAPKNAIIFDPFIGSGTVLYTAGCLGLKALGCELNPAAWILSKTYQLINLKQEEREKVIASVNQKIDNLFSISSFFESQYYQPMPIDEFENKLKFIYEKLEGEESIIVDTLVILLDISDKSNLMREKIYKTSSKLYELIRDMPYSEEKIISFLDVLIVRKNKRLPANIRQQYKTPESRKRYRQSYADFLESSKYYSGVFQRMINKIQILIDDTAPEIDKILKIGHF